MTIDAIPSSSAPTHHLSLEDGSGNKYGVLLCDGKAEPNPRAIIRTPIQRTSLQTQSGGTRYSDFSEPFKPIPQDNWAGGRGQEDFERDTTRFFDSYRLNTWMANQCVLGPQEQYTTFYRTQVTVLPGDMAWQSLSGSTLHLARSWSNQLTWSADRAYFWVRRVGTPGNIVLELSNDSGGNPGSALQTVTVTPTTFGSDTASKLYPFDWSGTQSLTSGNTSWLHLYASAQGTVADHWEIGVSGTVGSTKQSTNGSSWAAASVGLYYRIVDADDDRASIFFHYKEGWYAVTADADGVSAPKMYLNGDRGVADANTGQLDRLIDATKSWTADQYNGYVVLLQAGTGQFEDPPWRVISDTTSTALIVSPNWEVTHDTTTEYVILGTNEWTEITGHGLTKPVTDVLVSNRDLVYFAQGDATTMRRFRGYNNSGTWTNEFAADGTNVGTFYTLANDPVNGMQVWVANVDQSGAKRANTKTWGTNLTLGSNIKCGNDDEHITGIERYGSPEIPWILKEGSIWSISNDIAEAVPLREMMQVQSETNGRAHLVHGVYLYLNLLHSLERFYRNNLDDVGPSRDFGLPSNRQGVISALVGYPGRFFASIDGGSANYSSILTSTGSSDWHEIYRAPEVGKRIRNMAFEVVPGTLPDRLWFSQGMDMMWLPFPSNTLDPTRDSNYLFTHEGHVITSWMYADLQDVTKLFKSVKVFGENYSGSTRVIKCDYQTDGADEDDAWTEISDVFNTVPVEEVNFSSNSVTSPATGRRVRLRFRFYTDDAAESPRMKATVVETIARVPTKFRYTATYRAKDEDIDLEGDDVSEFTRVETFMNQVDSWANTATPLTMRCVYSPFDNKQVLLDPSSTQPYANIADDQNETHIGQLVMTEI